MIIGIYRIYCIANKMSYIGQTTNWEKRLKKHKWELKNNKHLQNAWNKYGSKNFEFSLILECKEEDLDFEEKYWLNIFGYPDNKKVFNLESGGHANKHLSVETKEKISAFNKGKHLTKEHRKKLSDSKKGEKNPCYGKTYSSEERQKISLKMKSIKHNQNSINAIKQSNINKQIPVLQYDLNGNFIKEYSGIQFAARETKSQASLIHKVCNGERKKTNGFIWKYKKIGG